MPRPGIEPGPSAWQANTLPRRFKSRLVPQGSTSVSYTYHYYTLIHPDAYLLYLFTSTLQIVHGSYVFLF